MIRFAGPADFAAALGDLPVADAGSVAEAAARQAEWTKPAGSLGRLEEIALFMAGWQGRGANAEFRARGGKLANRSGIVFSSADKCYCKRLAIA